MNLDFALKFYYIIQWHISGVASANREINKLNDWFQTHKLCMNLAKTKFMIFSSHKKKSQNINGKLKINQTEICRTEEYKYLGCIISSNLRWNEHIRYIETKISRMVPMIYRIRYRLTKINKIMLYNSIVKPHLQYAIRLYSKTSEQNLNSLQRIQNKILKILFYKRRNENIDLLYREYSILKIRELAKYQIMQPIFKYVKFKGNIPIKTKEKFKKCNRINNRTNLRNRYNFATNRSKLDIGKKHSYYNTALWNNLPHDLKGINSLKLFKNKLKNITLDNIKN